MFNGNASDADASGLLALGLTYAVMLATPGPSFAVVTRVSVSASRREAAAVAAGVACGASLLIELALRGAAVLPGSTTLAEAGRLAGIVLLLVLGLRALRRALLPVEPGPRVAAPDRAARHFALGLATAFTNPVSFAFFSSVALASRAMPGGMANSWRLPLGVFLMAFFWFGTLAMLFSLPAVRALHGRAARRLDGLTGTVLIGMALCWLARVG